MSSPPPTPSELTRVTLCNKKAKGTLIPFVGAGFTTNINPKASFQELIVFCTQRSFADNNADLLAVCGNDSARALDFVIWKLGEQTRRSTPMSTECYRSGKRELYATVKTFLGQLGVHGVTPDLQKSEWRQHRALVRCYEDIITTNWDNTLESAGMAEGFGCQVHYSVNGELLDEVLGNGSSQKRTIIKFHGHLTSNDRHPDGAGSLVASETDYYRRVRRSDPLDDDLICRLSSKGLLFIGYSLKDVNVRYVLKQVNTVNRYFARTHPSYWVIAEPMPEETGDNISQLYRQFLLDDANITICPLVDWPDDDKEEWKNTSSVASWFSDRVEVIRDAWVALFTGI